MHFRAGVLLNDKFFFSDLENHYQQINTFYLYFFSLEYKSCIIEL